MGGHWKRTCNPGIGGGELGLCCDRHILGGLQLGFQLAGLLGFLSVVFPRLIFLPVQAPDEVASPLIEVVEGVRRGRRGEQGGALEASSSLGGETVK